MSNEKLGAEQGRETLQAIAQEIVANLGSCDASSDLGFKVIWATLDRHFGTGPKQAEQAHHARGAGRELEIRLDEAHRWNAQRVHHVGAPVKDWGIRRIDELEIALAGEPGADTGTTPPAINDELVAAAATIRAERYGGHNWDPEVMHILWHCAERLRATQRAPVEQGRPDMGEVSDGYHTFKELYEHRHALFSVICATFGGWKSKEHSDGTMFEDSFIAGVATPLGPATYHMPLRWWDRFHCQPSIRAPKWDGHTAQQVPERIASLAAPDHAREGALRGLVAECHAVLAFEHELREISVLGNTNVNAFKLKVEAAERALADGKEGGE